MDLVHRPPRIRSSPAAVAAAVPQLQRLQCCTPFALQQCSHSTSCTETPYLSLSTFFSSRDLLVGVGVVCVKALRHIGLVLVSSFEGMSVRRDVRLRKEFLYKKQQQTLEGSRDDKKRKLRHALESETSIPTEIVSEARELQHSIENDLDSAGEAPLSLDDEYAQVGTREPKVCVTTSRDPSSRLKQFAKEIKLCIPNSQVRAESISSIYQPLHFVNRHR